MYAYEVGKPYNPNVRVWPEKSEYNYRAGSHELILFFNGITAQEVQAVTTQPLKLGAIYTAPVLTFLYRFTGEPSWSDCPYSWHLVRETLPDQATIPPDVEELERALLSIILVEATTGIVKGIRVVSISIALTRMLHTAIRDQAAQAWDARAYDRALAQIQTQSADQLARRAERCDIGATR